MLGYLLHGSHSFHLVGQNDGYDGTPRKQGPFNHVGKEIGSTIPKLSYIVHVYEW